MINKTIFKERVSAIISNDLPIMAELYMCVKEQDGHSLRRIQLKDITEREFSVAFSALLNRYVEDEVEIKSMDDIEDNQKILYTITQTDDYCPFSFLENCQVENYDSRQQVTIIGYFIKLGTADNFVYLFQARNNTFSINNDKTFLIKKVRDVFVRVEEEFLRIEKRIDIIIMDKEIISEKTSILERSFGLERYIRKTARNTIGKISTLNIVSDTEVFFRYETKLRNSKKLMKIKNSPVFGMTKERIIERIGQIERYKKSIVVEDNMIVIKTQKDVDNVLKLLGDAILKSELTDEEYETMVKKKLEPIAIESV